MRIKLFLVTLVIFISCSKPLNKIEQIITKEEGSKERFKQFFEKFSNDSLFQISRIDSPLIVVKSEDVHKIMELIDVNYISFDQKDWEEKITYEPQEISHDTIKVTLQGTDTGLYIEHYFVLRNNFWFLFKIENLSN